ncbi:hypothetical protein [Maribacter litoralis]|uniref:hypothetical protein n=1 Tax=Maribacter litoralis TaxID=2059726 RepID=UPI0013DF291B|nr:hypothetical protein [Maribacter litoralis]
MNLKHKSIFNLIEIFTSRRIEVSNTVNVKEHCEHNHISDFYCDSDSSSGLTRVFNSLF